MAGFRTPKTLFVILAVLVAALYTINVSNSNPSNIEILSYDLNYQPDRIKVDVELQNNSDKEAIFEAISLHCSDAEQKDVTFKVLNNGGDDAIKAADTTPIRLAAKQTYKLTLIAEKNSFYKSAASCQRIAASWKIKNERNYYGSAIQVH